MCPQLHFIREIVIGEKWITGKTAMENDQLQFKIPCFCKFSKPYNYVNTLLGPLSEPWIVASWCILL